MQGDDDIANSSESYYVMPIVINSRKHIQGQGQLSSHGRYYSIVEYSFRYFVWWIWMTNYKNILYNV